MATARSVVTVDGINLGHRNFTADSAVVKPDNEISHLSALSQRISSTESAGRHCG